MTGLDRLDHRTLWRGVIEEYRELLDLIPDDLEPVTLREGGTPLVPSAWLSRVTGGEVHLKVEGDNPTGSFKDRGMTAAISVAKHEGAEAVVCASTGNTSASMAAYAARAGLTPLVLIPEGKIAAGKMAQAVVHGARIIMVRGNFDHCLQLARALAWDYPVSLVNSVNPVRLQGQKTAAFEVVDALGDAPDFHLLPVGNAGNISAYWMGYEQYADLGKATKRPRMRGFQAEGAAPLVTGEPFPDPETVATAIRVGNPASWKLAESAVQESEGRFAAVTDAQILDAQAQLARTDGVFVEPASAAGIAGLLADVASNAAGVRRRDRRRHRDRPRPQGHRRPRSRAPATSSTTWSSPTSSRRPRPPASSRLPRQAVTFVEGRVRVTVPATSANLGPGFDSLGLALALRDEVGAEVLGDGVSVTVRGEGADTVPRDESHLVVRSMLAAFDLLGARPPGLAVTCRNVIPHGRGLGSSSAAIVAGVSLARALVAGGSLLVDDDRLFALAAQIEGHPDNVAPAFYGGLVISGQRGRPVLRRPGRRRPAGQRRGVRAADRRWQTTVARGLLPDTVPHADAAANAGRAALLVAALAGRPEHLLLATRDLLHQDYRAPAMPDSAALVAALRADGVPAIVSGAGPTVLAFCDGPDLTPGSAEALLDRCPAGWTASHLEVERAGRGPRLSQPPPARESGDCATDATSAGSWC